MYIDLITSCLNFYIFNGSKIRLIIDMNMHMKSLFLFKFIKIRIFMQIGPNII